MKGTSQLSAGTILKMLTCASVRHAGVQILGHEFCRARHLVPLNTVMMMRLQLLSFK